MPPMKRRDFRSDTITRPTEMMRDAMRNAEVGDDVYQGDPTVNRLQEMAADKLGKDASLFVPSGTFGNQCAIGLHTQPGDEVILGETTHTLEHECGAGGALWGVQMRPVMPLSTSYLRAEDIKPRLRVGDDVHIPRTGLIMLENALADGTVMPIEEMRKIKQLADEHDVPVHLDGARIFNAALALGVDPKEIATQTDSIMFCLSKGLGAPVGSLLLGPAEFINRARKRRKMMGGGMRQVGVLAAPGIIALTKGVEQLDQDHANAKLLGSLLADIRGLVIDPESIQTNMVFCRVNHPDRSEAGLVAYLEERNFINYPPLSWGLRFVLSSEIDKEDVHAFAKAIAAYME